jgi:hypothetical protein
MERRYQVFISSTFTDLVDERREIMQALLEMDCIPAGMELFPAGNTDQWTLIKGVIEQSDYYLVVLGGRYGSVTEEGVSYTEKEYDYAVELGIPVMGFVPANADAIPAGKTDKNEEAAEKLAAFQKKVQLKLTRDWKSAEDLGSKVTRGLMHLIKNNQREGWVRGDQAMTSETRAEIAELHETIARFEKIQAERNASSSLEVDKTFAHGTEPIEVHVTHTGMDPQTYTQMVEEGSLMYTWDEIIELIGPYMIDEASEPSLRKRLDTDVLRAVLDDEEDFWTNLMNSRASISDSSWGTIIVQLRALGVIQTGTKRRTVSDRAVYWRLTPAGDDYLVALRAIPHDPNHIASKA